MRSCGSNKKRLIQIEHQGSLAAYRQTPRELQDHGGDIAAFVKIGIGHAGLLDRGIRRSYTEKQKSSRAIPAFQPGVPTGPRHSPGRLTEYRREKHYWRRQSKCERAENE